MGSVAVPAAAAGGGAASRPTRPRQRAAPPITDMQQHAGRLTTSNRLAFITSRSVRATLVYVCRMKARLTSIPMQY